MRISIANQPQIERVSSALKQSLATMAAAIQTGWNQQHDGDGGHTNVTAASATVAGIASVGRLVLNTVTYTQPVAGDINDLTTPGIENAAHLRINHTASPLFVRGIDARGRRNGEVLIVTNADLVIGGPADIWLFFEQATSLPENRIAETLASPAPGTQYILQGGRSVMLIYDFQQNTSTSGAALPRWRIVDQA